MAKSREKIQQQGFWDTEISKPDHDAVCLWVYESADTIFRVVCPDGFDRKWTKEDLDLRGDKLDQSATNMANAFASTNPRPNPRVFKRTWEYVLKSYTGYQDKTERIVGYADVLLETEFPVVVPKYKATTIGTREVGSFQLEWSRNQVGARILVEAKAVMPTFGELMRQIQLYRTAFGGVIVVVSPDDRYAKILAEQGVTFVKYNPLGNEPVIPTGDVHDVAE